MYKSDPGTSRPTRGAWIEIVIIIIPASLFVVAPHTGRVD